MHIWLFCGRVYSTLERFAAFLVPSKIGFLADGGGDGGGSDGGSSGSGGSHGGSTGSSSGDGGSGAAGAGAAGAGAARPAALVMVLEGPVAKACC